MMAYKVNAGKRRRWPKMLLFVSLAGVVLLVIGIIGVKNLYEHNLKAVNPAATTDIPFVIESGDSVPIVADGLKQKDLIRSEQAFVQYVRSNDLAESFKAGTYSLRQSYDVPTIVSYFVGGKVDTNLFTILPGQRLDQIRQAFIDKGNFSAAEVDAALEPGQYEDHPALVDKPKVASLEGYLYPDSYERVAETTPETIIRQSLDEMAEALTPDIRAGIAAQGLSVYQGIVFASLVEKEVGATDQEGKPTDYRPKVAQVFFKRLRSDIRLESNATDNFPAEYDTYSITGLPPGPISNVSRSSLEATIKPAGTDFTYFVSGSDCVTRFSQTIEQHEALINQHGLSTEEGVNCRG